jgi:hypothetical protein
MHRVSFVPDSPLMLWLGIAAAMLVLAAIAAALWWRTTAVAREVERTLRTIGHDAVRGVVVPDGLEGPIYIECVLVGARALVVLDLRDVRGAVFGAEKMDEWTVLDGVKRFTFRNPLVALHDRVNALRHHLGDEVEVQGRIVFSPRASFPKGVPPRAIALRGLSVELVDALGVGGAPLAPAVEAALPQLLAIGTSTRAKH